MGYPIVDMDIEKEREKEVETKMKMDKETITWFGTTILILILWYVFIRC